ncbi:septum site-determining protein MinC [Sphaerotilus hippei]|uniref:Probable septum site-determining protein MinC n=1 Tax=Sphaerotilus hippei TaxID=744406 RepID=A0A318H330_9BURK|nr:septum site-determining protein MinC [Sphaerotilus hippei]PXW97937.1 septum site-determining protein MinC [Sphaerotilus hippei]
MPAITAGNAPGIFELKSATWSLLAVHLRTADPAALELELERRFSQTPDLFSHEAVLLDLSALTEPEQTIDWARCLELLRRYKMLPVAARSGTPAQMDAAALAGLALCSEEVSVSARASVEPAGDTGVLEVIREVAVAGDMLVVDKPLRSGQQVYARGGDLVVLAQVNHGAEVIADGSVHVYAPLRGKAIAGARGNISARIFSTCMEPELISIAGIYRTTENPLPADVLGSPAQIRLDGEKLVVERLKL